MNKSNYSINPKKCFKCFMALPFEKRRNKFCSHSCSAIVANTNRVVSEEHKNKLSETMKKKVKNGTYVLSNPKKERIRRICEWCKKQYSIFPYETDRKFCSKECGYKGMNCSNNGGFREKSGTSKKGWYKGIWCGSSWELAWVIYHFDKQIPFLRNLESFKYNFSGKDRKYYPDFKIGEQYIEIKGYKKEDVDYKVNQFPKDKKLVVLYKNDLKEIFDYVYSKYGKNIHELYDK